VLLLECNLPFIEAASLLGLGSRPTRHTLHTSSVLGWVLSVAKLHCAFHTSYVINVPSTQFKKVHEHFEVHDAHILAKAQFVPTMFYVYANIPAHLRFHV